MRADLSPPAGTVSIHVALAGQRVSTGVKRLGQTRLASLTVFVPTPAMPGSPGHEAGGTAGGDGKMRMTRCVGLDLAIVAAGALATFGVAGGAAAQEGKPDGTLVAAFSADPGGFDPARGPSGMSHVVIEQVYSTLPNLDENAKPYAGIAESWSAAEDGLSWTFKLRPGLTFHDGEVLSADDVVYSFERILDPDSGYAYSSQIETIDKVTAIDDLSVEFKLNRVTGPFEIYMAFPGSSIVPKDLVESGSDLNAQPVGSGPFKFVSHTPRDSIVFERNDYYYEEGRPYFDGMVDRVISDPTALSNGIKSGEIHFSNEVPPKDWNAITSQAGMVDASIEGLRYFWMVPNHERGTMDVVPAVNGWVLTAHTDRLKNFKPMRTGFLKTLKDAWLE